MKTRAPLAFAIAMINASLALPAFSADTAKSEADKKDNGQLEEIIVTATKRETNLMETPIAITVFNQETLSREGLTNVKDLGKMVPNMDITFDTTRSAPQISMRGVRSTNNTELGDPSVGLHLDGVYSARPQAAMSLMFDVERVEAQRGPQGTLFGRNSTVGNINIISKRPQMDSFEGSIGAEVGRWNQEQLHGVINIPVSDTFALRASFMQEKRDSYLNGYWDANQYDNRFIDPSAKNAPLYTGPEENKTFTQRARGPAAQEVIKADPSDFYNNADQYAFRIAGFWKPTDDFSWLLTYENFVNNSAGNINTIDCKKAKAHTFMLDDKTSPTQGCEWIYGRGADEYTAMSNAVGKGEQNIKNLRSNIRWDFSDKMALVYNAGFSKQTQTSVSDLDFGTSDYDMTWHFDGAENKTQSHEIQLQSTDKESPLEWIVGAFYFKEKNNMQGGLLESWQQSTYWDQPDRTTESKAGFAQGTYSFTDDLHFTLGFRHTQDTKQDVGGRALQCASWTTDQQNGGNCFPGWGERAQVNALSQDYFMNKAIYQVSGHNDSKGTWSANNYRIGLDYDVDKDIMVFGYLANGYKSGGIGDKVKQDLQDPKTAEFLKDADGNQLSKYWDNNYKPEYVTTLEAGIKADLFDHSLRLTASAFYSDYTDMQATTVKTLFYTYGKEMDPVTNLPTGEINSNPSNTTVTDNIGKAKIRGIEVEFDWAATANDRVKGFVTMLHSAITNNFVQKWDYATQDLYGISQDDAGNQQNAAILVNMKGNELPSAPNYTLNINYSHTFDLSDGATLMPWITWNWRDKSYYTYFNVDKHQNLFKNGIAGLDDTRPSSAFFNLGLKYTAPGDQWNVEAFVNNATNTVDFYNASEGDFLTKGPVSMPRFYGLRANYKF